MGRRNVKEWLWGRMDLEWVMVRIGRMRQVVNGICGRWWEGYQLRKEWLFVYLVIDFMDFGGIYIWLIIYELNLMLLFV